MINVTSSVVTNDFLKRYFAKNLTQKQLVRFGQLASVGAIAVGFIFSLSFNDIVSAWETMIFVVVTMILAPATMRWHWWRFGARAFVWSMIVSALIIVLQKILFPGWPISTSLAVATLGSLGVTLLFGFIMEPSEMEVLVKFYSKIRPFGFWKPVRLEAERRGLVPVNDPMPRIDVMNGFITIFFQGALALIPFFLFLRQWNQMYLSLGILVVLSVVLYFTWYKNLPSPEEI
jgi:hypothetical protein